MAQDCRFQTAIMHGDRAARAKRHITKCAAILGKRDLRFSSAIEIIKDSTRKASLRDSAEIFNIDDF